MSDSAETSRPREGVADESDPRLRVAVGADHAGYRYKQLLADRLREQGYGVLDLGTDSEESVDYPDYARAVGEAVGEGRADRGLLVCGSAVGVSVAANKVPGVRAAVCHDTYSAAQGVEHDDLNVLCLGERVIGIELARHVVDAFLGATFSDAPRHRRRLEKVRDIERHYAGDPAEREEPSDRAAGDADSASPSTASTDAE